MSGIRKERKQDAGDKFTAIFFVLCAFGAVFVGFHKDAILEGRIVEVVLSYVHES